MKPFHVAAGLLAPLSVASLFVGASPLSIADALTFRADSHALLVLFESRLPRTLALILAGVGLAVAGLIMQILVSNRFVEPSTAGTVESASLGMLLTALLAPGAPVPAKMAASALCALAGTLTFLRLLKAAPLRSPLTPPLVGLMLGGVVGSATAFLAYRFDMLQSLTAWTTGDFSVVLRGRYELLWLALGLTVAAYAMADRLTVAGLGEDVAANLGLNHAQVTAIGLAIVAMITAATVSTVGAIPFLGLIVPNLVSMAMGDNLRRTLPFVAAFGAVFTLACDVAGRLLAYPFEIPIGVVAGALGSGLFLALLLRRRARSA